MQLRNPLLALVAAFALLACGESRSQDASPSEKSSVPPDLNYEIISEDTYQNERRSLDVRLNRKADEDELEALAYRLREQTSGSFERTFIVYYLPGTEVEVHAGGWATSHFDPELDVQILGVSEELILQVRRSESHRHVGK